MPLNKCAKKCDPGATRTHGQWLKRPLLYQLSYGIEILKIRGGKLHEIIPRFIEKDLELHSKLYCKIIKVDVTSSHIEKIK